MIIEVANTVSLYMYLHVYTDIASLLPLKQLNRKTCAPFGKKGSRKLTRQMEIHWRHHKTRSEPTRHHISAQLGHWHGEVARGRTCQLTESLLPSGDFLWRQWSYVGEKAEQYRCRQRCGCASSWRKRSPRVFQNFSGTSSSWDLETIRFLNRRYMW